MRSDWLRFGWLIGLLIFGTGASADGVRQAEQWHREAEVARAFGQWDVVYDRSLRAMQAFPGMPHARLAARLALQARDRMVHPSRSSASEDPVSWTNEAVDFFVWP